MTVEKTPLLQKLGAIKTRICLSSKSLPPTPTHKTAQTLFLSKDNNIQLGFV